MQGLATGPETDLDLEVAVADVNPFYDGLSGPLEASGRLFREGEGYAVDFDATGPLGAVLTIEGVATGPEADLSFALTATDVSPLAPGLSGPLDASGRLFRQGEGYAIDFDASGPLGATLSAEGVLTGADPAFDFALAVPNIAPIVPELRGPLRVEGSAAQQGEAWAVDVDLTGPSGTNAAVAGTVGTDGTLGLSVTGSAPLGMANAFIEPQRLAGNARFDLRASGPPALNSISGTISTANAAVSLPTIRYGLDDIDATVTLAGGQARIALTARPQDGGRLSVNGPVGLSAPFNADLDIAFDSEVVDPSLYRADIDAAITIDGPLAGGARIGGRIVIDDAEISVPSSGVTAIGDLPEIDHLGATRPVRRTLARAGQDLRAEDEATGGGGPVYALDLTLSAPSQIFIRGRGLDAELGGQLRVTGTTANPITAGGFELIRGRLDILQQRFDLDEGRITFQGGLAPFIRLVAETTTDTITAAIVIEGPADDIEVRFESTPEVPQEEVVAQIFFGRDLSQLSPLQAVQLANSVAVLAGRGSGGLLGNLRGGAGLDDLDITTDQDGNVGVRAGKYISDNVYTDVQVDQNGDAAVSLNIDLTRSLTLRGSAGADGETGLGVFFERDY